ncbi:MAG: signal peptide peptidase SppA [Balneolaceae bacterium]|nr:signal peptide peptidase SppA [Balneolaceae bacterium]
MQFFKTFLASILGTILGVLVLILILFATLVSSSTEPEPYIRSNTVLTINLPGSIPAKAVQDPVEELFNPQAGVRFSLESLKNNLRKAAADDNIKAVWVKANFVGSSWANLQTARRYFSEFKESGKPLYFSTDDIGFNEQSYFLATTADSIFSPPQTNFQFDGFVAQFTFYSDMLDKIGVEPQIFRVGEFKSAVEPFTSTSSSPESRQQTREILDAATSTFVSAVMERTGYTSEQVNELLNTPPVDRVNFALENGLIDAIAFDDEIENMIKARIGEDEDDDLTTVSFGRYGRVSFASAGVETPETDDKIAVIYASGVILPELPDSPFSNSSGITSSNLKKQIDSALEDDVKAIVVHINSPGGAATTSDLLWHQLRSASEKVPVVASMGSVAASGGYYMAMGADTVLAAENTLTGSIGIFNLLFSFEELMEDKIGIDSELLTTHEYAALYDLSEPFTPSEESVIQESIENGYEAFLARVAENRGMTRDEADEVARGRVYTGTAALEAGLIDIIGDIDRAIEVAADMAEIETYRIDTYPKQKDIYETLFGSANAQMKAMLTSWIPSQTKEDLTDIHMLLNHPKGMNWALMPVKIEID